MTARADVERWRQILRAAIVARALLAALGAAALAAAVVQVAGGTASLALVAGAGAALVAALALTWRLRRAPLTAERTALWIEEREPGLRWALVSAIEMQPPHERLERAVRAIAWERPARATLQRALRLPLALALAGAVALVAAPRLRAGAGVDARRGVGPAPGGAPSVAASLGAIDVLVTPPAYTARPAARQRDPAVVRLLAGSRVELRGAGRPPRLTLRGAPLEAAPAGTGWRAAWIADTARALVRAVRGGVSRLVAIEPVADSAPVVTLRAPARDTVRRLPRGAIALHADARDDIALATLAFEYIVSSGEGERFTFRSGTLGDMRPRGATATLRTTLSLEGLRLAPGDVVHLRAVARDANAVGGPGAGTSETRTIRIARQGEYDSLAVEAAPPPEVDRSLLSQRMLINLTEALVRRSRTLPREQLVAESRRLERDQARLRRQVSDIVFSRFGDEPSGEHFHGDGHQHGETEREVRAPMTPEQLLAAAEAASRAGVEATGETHDEAPIVAVNRPLLEAYNAMWDAGRALGTGEPRRALPPMYRALAAIQRARAAERIYLRGAPPPVVVDIAKVRLTGKEKGDPSPRAPRQPLDEGRRAALARFGRAITLLARSDVAGTDTLLVLRSDVAGHAPTAAAALEGAIEALRAGRDATDALVRSRRALDGDWVTRDSLAAWGSPR